MGKRLTYSCDIYDRMRHAKHARFSLYRCKGCRHWHIGTKHIRM
jgi:hypothetical protein